MSDEPIRILSISQPYASFIAAGVKSIETRNWTTSYRGWVAIHASKSTDTLHLAASDPTIAPIARAHLSPVLPLGAVIAIGWLNESIRSRGEVPAPYLYGPHEAALGDFRPGRGLLIFDPSTIRRLPEPLPMRGVRGIMPLQDQQIERALRELIR